MSGPNIGNLLNAKHVTWGWFEGGFKPTGKTPTGQPICGSAHNNIGGVSVTDYIPHHEPFQYYQSTANPFHLSPASLAEVGHNGQANHQYDLSWFYKALSGGNMPSVSFLKAAAYQDGHAGLLGPDRRAALPRQDDQRNPAVEVLAEHRDRHRVRRLRWLVRPRHAAHRQPLCRSGH